MDLSCKSINLFPTYFWKLKVPNHQIIKDKYLQSFIDGYDNNIYRVPKGWVTHKCHTSFEETKLIDKDIYMVNCIPIIQEVLDKCDCDRTGNCKLVQVDKIKDSLPDLVQKLKKDHNKLFWLKVASGMMTTDTKPKVAYEEIIIGDELIRICGIAKAI